MKYEYGVEYQCNGKKPDLPDGVVVEQLYRGCWYAKKVEYWRSWDGAAKFRITDERYKPKPEDNTWFERGELPPAGIECEAVLTPCTNYGIKCIILDDKNIAHKVGKEWKTTAILYGTTFRPIRTEREKAIEAASKIMHEAAQGEINDLSLGALYDAGLLRLPEEK